MGAASASGSSAGSSELHLTKESEALVFSGISCVYVLPAPVTLLDLPVDNPVVPAYDASNGTRSLPFFHGSAEKVSARTSAWIPGIFGRMQIFVPCIHISHVKRLRL